MSNFVTARCLAGAALCVLAALGARPVFAAAPPALVDATARVEPSATGSGKAMLKLKADGLTADQMAKTPAELLGTVTDLDADTPTKVRPIEVNELTKGQSTRLFLLTLHVANVARNDSQTRYLRFTFAGTDQVLQYTLTSAPAATFAWYPKASPRQVISPGEPIQISVPTGPVAATGVKLLQAALANSVTKGPMSGGNLYLCPTRNPCKPSPDGIALGANTPNQVYVYGTSGPGQYSGSITIAANEKPGGDALEMTVYSSSAFYKLVGTGAIALGLALSWLLTLFLKNRLLRDQMLLPAIALREVRNGLETRLKRVVSNGIPAPATTTKLAALENELTDGELEKNGLPVRRRIAFPSPLAKTPTEYQTYLDKIGAWLAALTTIVEGLERAEALDIPTDPKRHAEVVTAAGKIDAFSGQPAAPSSADLLTGINGAIAEIHTAFRNAGAAFTAQPAVTEPSERSIRVEIARMNDVAWVTMGVVIVAAGVLILIAPMPGYGTWTDWFTSFLWGLGLPSGAALATATSTSITSTFTTPR